MTGLSVTGFVLVAISFKAWRRAERLAARLAGPCSWAVCKVLLIGVASGCDTAEALSAPLPNGFGYTVRPGKVFLDSKFVNLSEICVKQTWHRPEPPARPRVLSKGPFSRKEAHHAHYQSPRSGVFFERMSKRRRGFPSEAQVKRGQRVVHGDKELVEKLGRNDLCPCGSGKRFKKCCLKSGRF